MLNPHTGGGKVNGSQKSFLRSTRIWTGNESITVCCLCALLKVGREEERTKSRSRSVRQGRLET